MSTAQQLFTTYDHCWDRGGDRLDVGLLSSTFGVIPRYDSWRPVYAFLIVYNKKKREFKSKTDGTSMKSAVLCYLQSWPPREIRSLLWVRFRIICYKEQKPQLATKRTQFSFGGNIFLVFLGQFCWQIVANVTKIIPRVCKAILQRSNKTTNGKKHKAFDFTNY